MRVKVVLVYVVPLLSALVSVVGPCTAERPFPLEYVRSFDHVRTRGDSDRACRMARKALLKAPDQADCALRCLELCGSSVSLPAGLKGDPRVLEKLLHYEWFRCQLSPLPWSREEKTTAQQREVLERWIETNPENALPRYLLVAHLIRRGNRAEAAEILRSLKSPRITYPSCRLPTSAAIRFVRDRQTPRALWDQPVPPGLLRRWYSDEPVSDPGTIRTQLRSLCRALPSLAQDKGGLSFDEVGDALCTLALSIMWSEPLEGVNVLLGLALFGPLKHDPFLSKWRTENPQRYQHLLEARRAIVKEMRDLVDTLSVRYPEQELETLVKACIEKDPVDYEREEIVRILSRYEKILTE